MARSLRMILSENRITSPCVAFCTARTTRLWMPQRHKCGSSAATMSSRLGLGLLFEQRRRRDQDAGQAIAALAGLLVEEGLLQRRRARHPCYSPSMVVMDLPPTRADLARAGIGRLAVDQHHAGAALLGAAAELGAAQAELVAQHRQQRRAAVGRRRETGRPLTTNSYCSRRKIEHVCLSLQVRERPTAYYCATLMPLASMNFDQFLISFSSFALSAGPGANDGSVSTLASRSLAPPDSASWSANAFSSLARIGSGRALRDEEAPPEFQVHVGELAARRP